MDLTDWLIQCLHAQVVSPLSTRVPAASRSQTGFGVFLSGVADCVHKPGGLFLLFLRGLVVSELSSWNVAPQEKSVVGVFFFFGLFSVF